MKSSQILKRIVSEDHVTYSFMRELVSRHHSLHALEAALEASYFQITYAVKATRSLIITKGREQPITNDLPPEEVHGFTVENVIERADDDEIELSDKESARVMWWLHKHADASIGVTWDDIRTGISEVKAGKEGIGHENI